MLKSFLFSIFYFTVYHRRQCTDKRCYDCRRNNPRRVHAPVLLPVSDHIHWYQLQRRNIQNQKRTHLIAGDALPLPFLAASRFHDAICSTPIRRRIPSRPPLRLQLRQFLHRLKPPLCQVSDTNFLKKFLK